MKSLLTYLNGLSMERREQFASGCGTTVGYLRKACSANQRLGADLCISIERESAGVVKCEVLRPDVDWAYLRATNCDSITAPTPAPSSEPGIPATACSVAGAAA